MRRSVTRSSLVGIVLALAVIACSASPAAAPGTSPAATAPPTPSTATPPAASVTPAPTPRPTPTPVAPITFDSAAYGYRATIPADLVNGPAAPASQPWDGVGQINSDGLHVDRFPLTGSRLVFVYGAPTDLPLAAYATEGQRLKAAWHGCPETPDTAVDAAFDGTPARLHAFDCGGLRVLSLFVVVDGAGLVVNQLAPPGDPAATQAAFEDLVAGWTRLP